MTADRASSAALYIDGLRKEFRRGSEAVIGVDSLNLEVNKGELVVLLGPSGCGKTTTLRTVAGLERPNSGAVAIDGSVATDISQGMHAPPERRNVGMVFQNYALWPHMTVRKNIEYPLKARRLKEGLREGWTEEVARVVECSHLLDRYPAELSGGQQQRIALARGLVARPKLMLFDEPLSNLDARLRTGLRREIRALHEELGFAGLYVTHDQQEAMAVGDRVVVMKAGSIEQQGEPEEIFRKPANSWVADFFGLTNSARIFVNANGGWSSEGAELTGEEPKWPANATELRLRPEDVQVEPVDHVPEGRTGVVGAQVVRRTFSGLFWEYDVRFAEGVWNVRGNRSDATVQVGSTCTISFLPSACSVYDASGALLT